MKALRFVLSIIIVCTLLIVLNTTIDGVPPLGKFLSPHHGFWQNAETPDIKLDKTVKLDGLSEPVLVQYDEQMIPHISASNQRDLSFVQGYVTAKDRLWQMDFYARVVFGRLSEILGTRALDFDRLQRRIGLNTMTQNMYHEIIKDDELKTIISAYTQGVNAYIDQLNYADYPVEFKLLDYKPERWSELKSCMAYGLLSNTLSRSEADLENTNAFHLFGEELFNILYPEKPKNIDPVIPKGTQWDFQPLKPDFSVMPENQITRSTIQKPDPLNGSNNFAVSGKKSKSGNPILANEPDLQLTLPSIWHTIHLQSNTTNVMGVTVPGTPVILIGFNDSIAWGVTNSPRDQVDWYTIEFRDSTRQEYRYNDQWFKTAKKIEQIDILDAEPFYDTIINVHYGPLVYDRNFHSENGKLNAAMKWIAHEKSTTFKAMHKINQAHNHHEFTMALKDFTGPPQNFIFASSNDTIALHLPGKFPNKWAQQGKFLMDGSDPRQEYSSYIPFEHHLMAKNPEKGFLSSANQHPADSLYPYYTYDHNYEYYRNRRINERLSTLNKVEPDDLKELQNDNFNYRASEILPLLLDSLDTISFREQEWKYFNTLKNWDYFSESELTAPTVYEMWWDHLYDLLWDEFDTIQVAIDRPNTNTTIDLIKSRPNFDLWDILETPTKENAKMVINLSYQKTIDSLSSWMETKESLEWYKVKNTSINHLLRLSPFSETGVKIGGYKNIVNAASRNHGPSWRMVVELTKDGPIPWGIYPGSQTGNPGNPRYGHMIDDWATGNYHKLTFNREPGSLEGIQFKQSFIPE